MTCAALAVFAVVVTQASFPVTGRVVDATGLPLPGVLIGIKGDKAIAVDERRRLVRGAGAHGATLLFALPGFLPREVPIGRQMPASPMVITLAVAGVSEAVTVRGQAPPPDGAALALTPLDVEYDAGHAGRSMRALGTLPGVARIDDGTGLFVRGGDVSETLVLLDGVVVSHPYRYETPTGGFRGAIDPFLTQGVSFTTGGFSAQYANTLSGVVDPVAAARPPRDANDRDGGPGGALGFSGLADW